MSESKFSAGELRAAQEVMNYIRPDLEKWPGHPLVERVAQIIHKETRRDDWQELLDAIISFLEIATLKALEVKQREGKNWADALKEAKNRLQTAIVKVM